MADLVHDVVEELFDSKMSIVDGILDIVLEVVMRCSRSEDDISIIDTCYLTWSLKSRVQRGEENISDLNLII